MVPQESLFSSLQVMRGINANSAWKLFHLILSIKRDIDSSGGLALPTYSLNRHFPSQSPGQGHMLGSENSSSRSDLTADHWTLLRESTSAHFSAPDQLPALFCWKRLKVLTRLASPLWSFLLVTFWGELRWVGLDSFEDLDSWVRCQVLPTP